MKVLVTGGQGQLALAMAHSSLVTQYKTQFVSHQDCDIGNIESLEAKISSFCPDIIVNTAAFTAVDEAEKHPEKALYVNEFAVRQLALVCAREKIPLIHFSTDYVFDGQQQTPYTEEDAATPVNVYGLSKYKGENAIRELCEAYIILRVSSLFSERGKNFVKTILQLSKTKKELSIVSDQWHCPTSTDSIASALYQMIPQFSDNNWGTYHFCNSPSTTWFGFCEKILAVASHYPSFSKPLITPIGSAEYAAAANRPRFSVLNCDKIIQHFNVCQKDWLADLKKVISLIMQA